jgi:exodeoxyribonuclease VII small subunit
MSDAKRNSGDASGMQESRASEGAESLSFEGALDQLEQTVARLEGGEMPLEEALELFEAGVELSRQCNQTLEAAERRIEILVADRADENGDFETDDFESDIDLEGRSEEDGSEDFEE